MKLRTQLFCFVLITFACFSNLKAQGDKVSWDNDIVRVNGESYAYLKKKSVGPMRNDFSVSSMGGTELLYFKSMLRPYRGRGFKYGNGDELYYEVNFIASGSKADLKHYSGNGFAKLIVENNLVSGEYVDFDAEKRFIQLNNGYIPMQYTPAPVDKNPAVVVNINNNGQSGGAESKPVATPSAPKSKSLVTINGNQIIRDEVVIGKFKQETTSSAYSQKMVMVIVYTEDGEKVAEASVPAVNPQEWAIKIIVDNKSFNILYDEPNEKEKLFKWLSDKNYLSN